MTIPNKVRKLRSLLFQSDFRAVFRLSRIPIRIFPSQGTRKCNFFEASRTTSGHGVLSSPKDERGGARELSGGWDARTRTQKGYTFSSRTILPSRISIILVAYFKRSGL